MSYIVWRPDAATVARANLTRFMRALAVNSFDALNERASPDPARGAAALKPRALFDA